MAPGVHPAADLRIYSLECLPALLDALTRALTSVFVSANPTWLINLRVWSKFEFLMA
jgi:hypothetical protein